jgi:glyoxylase-like metal-dependent hydrolase (beta-lactamase superfamily II)
VIQRGEYDFATHLNERTRGSYRSEDYVVLEKLGLYNFADGAKTILNGVRVVRSGGHVPYHQSVLLESDSKKAFFLGDLLPTHAHISLPYIMAFDLNPLETLEKKREYLEKAADEDWLLFFPHDPEQATGRVEKSEHGFRLKE